MNKYILANLNCFTFFYIYGLLKLYVLWRAMVALQNAYVFLCVSINQIPFGGSRIVTNLILLNLLAINCKYLEVWC